MAKRSDFAQKLLDDLRLRKERMAAASQGSRTSNSTAIDAYAYSKQTHKGSRDVKTHQTIGPRAGNTPNRSNKGNRLLTNKEASNQIVPYRRAGNMEQRGDLSLALAFALENGGKLRMASSGNGSMLAFLNQIGRGSMEFGKMERRSSVDRHRPSTSRFQTVSYLHIQEISKGAQKLNQILSACSNGLNFDGYSIEIGKELLKGAIDLEESLRMLVNLQEASDYMIAPQRKNRITLLEDDEDDSEDTVNIAEQWQLDRPRFSFDNPSRSFRKIDDVARSDIKQRLIALTYPGEANNFNQGKQAIRASNSVSHTRSASYGPDVKMLAAFSEQKNHSSAPKSKPEKGRIPNVIAKLMGIDELPESADSKYPILKKSSSKDKLEAKTAQGSAKNAEPKTKDTKNLIPSVISQKEIRNNINKIPVTQDRPFELQAEKNLGTRAASFEVMVDDRKPPWKDMENRKPVIDSKKATINMNKQQSNTNKLKQNNGGQKHIQEKERKQDNTKHREQEGLERSKTKEPVSKDELQQVAPQAHKRSEATILLQDKTEGKESNPQTEKRNANKLLQFNHQQPQNDRRFLERYVVQQSEPREEKYRVEERKQQSVKQNLQVRKQKGNEEVPKSLSKPIHDAISMQKKQPHMSQLTHSKESSAEAVDAMSSERFPNSTQHVRYGHSANSKVNMKDSANKNADQNYPPRDSESKSEKEKTDITPIMEEKPVRVPATQKGNSIKVHKSGTPRKIDEVITRRNGAPQNLAKPWKHKSSVLQDVKQRRHDKLGGSKGVEQQRESRLREAKAPFARSHKPEASIASLNVDLELKRETEQAFTLSSPVGDEHPSLEEPQTLAPNESVNSSLCQNITSRVANEQLGQAPVFGKDNEIRISTPLDGTYERSTDIYCPSQLERQNIIKSGTQEPLTESENRLKELLITCQLFLHTAEALFKLNIPFSILNDSGNECRDLDSKLILECGYEVMKRKGRRQELINYPCMKISMSSTKVSTLDDLVKQMHKDFEKLKFYGRDGNPECDVEDYLPKMLESDLYNRDPDVNCLWDLGWNEMVFAFLERDDVAKEVERQLLNGLLDEITRDLLCIHVF